MLDQKCRHEDTHADTHAEGRVVALGPKISDALLRAQRAVAAYERRAGAALAYYDRQHTLFGERPYVSAEPRHHAQAEARTEARIVAQHWSDARGVAQAHIAALERRGLATSEACCAAQEVLAQCQAGWRRWIDLGQ